MIGVIFLDNSYDLNLKRSVDMFRRNDRLHRGIFERQAVAAFGIHRSQHMILMYISRNPDASQRSIADEFEISAAAVATTLKKLEAGGFIVRSTSDADSRKNEIQITEKGRAVIADTHKLFSSIDFAMFEGLSSDEMDILAHCLEKMNENLRAACEKTPEQLKGEAK